MLNARGQRYLAEVNLPALYNVYNAAGAVAAVTEMGLGTEAAVSAIENFKCGFGRMENFKLGKSGAKMMLVKNPAGCNQVLDFLAERQGEVHPGGLPQRPGRRRDGRLLDLRRGL